MVDPNPPAAVMANGGFHGLGQEIMHKWKDKTITTIEHRSRNRDMIASPQNQDL